MIVFVTCIKIASPACQFTTTSTFYLLDLGKHGEAVKKLETKIFTGTFSGVSTRIELHTVSVERGMSWDEVMEIKRDHTMPNDGFYLNGEVCRKFQIMEGF